MKTFPDKPMPPILQGMSPTENENWLNAHNWAYSSIVAALQRVQDSDKPASNDYATWLETETIFTPRAKWEERRNIVINSLSKMATRMSTISVVYKKSDDPAKCLGGINKREAYSEIGTPEQAIGLCPDAFDDDHLRAWYWDSADWARALIVVHETYHTAVDTKETVATADSYYNWSICYQLPFWNPDLAVRNAQNYAYFVMGSFWRRPKSPPGWALDYGIWNDQTVGAGSWGAADSPAAAATTHTQNLVMVAYRERDEQGARLRYRILLLNEGREVWLDSMLFRIPRGDGTYRECRSLVAPALAAWGQEFYCAYIDPEDRKLLFARVDVGNAMSTGKWSELIWVGRLLLPDEIARDPLLHPSSMPIPSPSPALAVYRPDPAARPVNQSAGLYCVYVNHRNELKCSAHLDPGMSGRDRWISVDFDRPRSSATTPALLVFNGQLKCVYVDGDTGKLVTLNYRPVMSEFFDQNAGTWHEDSHPIPAMETETIALGQWNTSNGPIMVALGNNNAKITDNGSLRYSRFSDVTGWTKEERMTTLTSPKRPALVGCGSSLYLFYRIPDGTIESRVARQQA